MGQAKPSTTNSPVHSRISEQRLGPCSFLASPIYKHSYEIILVPYPPGLQRSIPPKECHTWSKCAEKKLRASLTILKEIQGKLRMVLLNQKVPNSGFPRIGQFSLKRKRPLVAKGGFLQQLRASFTKTI